MVNRYCLVIPLLCLCAMGSEKELKLADGRILRGELVGEKDGQLLLAMKAGQAIANVRVAKGDVLSVEEVKPAKAGGNGSPWRRRWPLRPCRARPVLPV